MIDYRSFLAKRDMHFSGRPKNIFEGPFAGNGSTGIVFYYKDDTLYMNLGNTDIYDNRLPTEEMTYKERENLFLSPRLSLGGFSFAVSEKDFGSEMRVSLYDGIITGRIFKGNSSAEFTAYTVENEEAVVFSWKENGISLSPEFSPSDASSPRQKMMKAQGETARSSLHYVAPKEPYIREENGATAFIQPKFTSGNYSVTYKNFVSENKKTLICVIGNNAGPDFGKADEIFENLSSVREAHDEFWHNFYTKSFLEIDDEEVDKFWWIQLYKCASATRAGKRIFDTAGPWLDNFTAWPAAWWNLNIELHYSLLYPANHLEIAASLPDAIRSHIEELRSNVPEKYRNGKYITVGRNTTESFLNPCGIPGVDSKEIELELGNILWALHNCYVHFSSDADDDALCGEFFDNLKNSVSYIVNYLVKEEDGKYHLPPTTSPEYPGIHQDCNYTMSLLCWAMKALLELDEKYGINDEEVASLREYSDNLAPFPYDEKQGFLIGRDSPLAMSHRHYSHLLMIYPLHLIDDCSEEGRSMITKSIEHWHSMPEALLGYSQTGVASMLALLGEGNKALEHIRFLFNGFICPNTMYNEDMNPVLETPPAAARSVLDMIMYSHKNEIRIFDAAPDEWQNIRYENLLSESACEVSATRENGETVYASVKAKKSRSIRLKVKFRNEPKCNRKYIFDGTHYVFDLNAGEEIIFTAE